MEVAWEFEVLTNQVRPDSPSVLKCDDPAVYTLEKKLCLRELHRAGRPPQSSIPKIRVRTIDRMSVFMLTPMC